MKFLVALACMLAAAAAFDEVTVLRNVAEVKPDGYNYAYELSNGVSASEAGELKDENIVAHGDFKFVSPEGEAFQVTYVADENGFQPTGEHLPVAPEVPILIQRALEYLAGHAVASESAPTAEFIRPAASAPVAEVAFAPENVLDSEVFPAESAPQGEFAFPAEEPTLHNEDVQE